MCNKRWRMVRWWSVILMGFGLTLPALADTDPPERVGRVSYLEGRLNVTQAGEDAPVEASVNYPVAAGMTFATESGAHAELQLGTLTTRLDGQTKLDLVAFDDQTVGMRLNRGSVDLRIRLLFENERVTVSTGDGQVVITEPGAYRIDANRVPAVDNALSGKSSDKTATDNPVTHVVVFAGTARVHSPHGADTVMGGEAVDVDGPRGTVRYGLADHTWLSAWAMSREQINQPGSERYVAEDIPGAGALDTAGTWQNTADYGAVWYPTDVPSGWAPYQSGTWTWVAPWGWTWIDSRPWGFVPFHYGRWVHAGGRWGWCPGDRHRRHTYAPALVNFGGTYKHTRHHRPDRWNPLGPGEHYRPPYRHGGKHVNYVNDGRPDTRKWRGRWRTDGRGSQPGTGIDNTNDGAGRYGGRTVDANGQNGGQNGRGRYGPGGGFGQGGNSNGNAAGTDTANPGGNNTPTTLTTQDGTPLRPGQRITLPTGGDIIITEDMIRRGQGGGLAGVGITGRGVTGNGATGSGATGSGITGGTTTGSPPEPTTPASPPITGSTTTDPGRRITLPTGGQIVITDDMIRRARGGGMGGGYSMGPGGGGTAPSTPTTPTTPAVNPAGLAPAPVTPMITTPGGTFAHPGVSFGAATQTGPTLTQPRAVTTPPVSQPTMTQPQVVSPNVAPPNVVPMGTRFQQFPAGVAPTNMGRYPTMPRITAPTPAAPPAYPTQMPPGMVPRGGGGQAYTGYPTTPPITAPTMATPPPTPPPTQINPTQLPQSPIVAPGYTMQGRMPVRVQ